MPLNPAPAAPAVQRLSRSAVSKPSTGDSGAGGKQEMLGMQYANVETPTVEIGGETYNVELVDFRQRLHHGQGRACRLQAGG